MKNAALQVWRFICSVVTFLFIWLRLYKVKSYIHRWIYDRKFKGTNITIFGSLRDLGNYMRRFIWRADSWSELFDAICTPEKVEAVLSARDPGVAGKKHGNDCDEMGIWQTASVLGSLQNGLLGPDGIKNAYLFTVMWMEGFSPQGHNLTLLERTDGKFAVLDYGRLYNPHENIDVLAQSVRTRYAKGVPTQSIGWSLSKLNLTPVKVRFKGP